MDLACSFGCGDRRRVTGFVLPVCCSFLFVVYIYIYITYCFVSSLFVFS